MDPLFIIITFYQCPSLASNLNKENSTVDQQNCLTHAHMDTCTKHPKHTPLVSLCLSHAVLADTISEVSLIVLNYALLCSLLSLRSPPPQLFGLLLNYLLSVLSQNKDASRQFALKKSKDMPEAQRQKERVKERKRLVFKIYTFLCLCFELEQQNFPKSVFCRVLSETWLGCECVCARARVFECNTLTLAVSSKICLLV